MQLSDQLLQLRNRNLLFGGSTLLRLGLMTRLVWKQWLFRRILLCVFPDTALHVRQSSTAALYTIVHVNLQHLAAQHRPQ